MVNMRGSETVGRNSPSHRPFPIGPPIQRSQVVPRSDVKRADGHSSERHAIGAAKTFESWLKSAKAEDMKLETIDLEELDTLLSEFYLTVKKKDGSEYSVNSLTSLRTGILYYLRKKGYMGGGFSPDHLPKSHAAFKQRIRMLP